MTSERPRHESSRPAAEVSNLADAVSQLVGVKSVRALSERVCASACALMRSDAASFVLVDGDRVYYADEAAPEAMWMGRYFPIGACISGWAATHQRSAVVDDVFDDARVPIEAYRPTRVRSMVMVPMILDGEPMGSVGRREDGAIPRHGRVSGVSVAHSSRQKW